MDAVGDGGVVVDYEPSLGGEAVVGVRECDYVVRVCVEAVNGHACEETREGALPDGEG